jgi:hypothetical protein
MQTRLITSEGGVSDDLYEVIGPADRKHCVFAIGSNGDKVRIHRERLLPVDSNGKLVAVMHNGKLKAACPECSRTLVVLGDSAECPVHGIKPITSHEHLNGFNNPAVETEKEHVMPKNEVTTIDLSTVAEFGSELWTKPQRKFSDPHTDVQSHVLLADNPPRKLCFNTYNGTLGKRKKSKTDSTFAQQLQSFKDNVTMSPDGASVYPLKSTLDDARKKLEKTGYVKK